MALDDELLEYVLEEMPLRCAFAPDDLDHCHLCGVELRAGDWIFRCPLSHHPAMVVCYNCGAAVLLARGALDVLNATWPKPYHPYPPPRKETPCPSKGSSAVESSG